MENFIQTHICNWPPCPKTNRPMWFWVIENVNSDLSGLGMEERLKKEFIQSLKKESFKSLNMRRNMLNLRKKHIPRIQEIYKTLLEEFIIQE